MSQIRAISAGANAETERFTGTVHSVFSRACNIALDDGRLLTLLAAEQGNAPNAVRLDTPPGFTFDRALRTGERIGCRAGVMRFGQAGISVRLASAHPWRHDLDGLGADFRDPSVFAAWRAARRCLRRHETANPSTDLTGLSVPPGRALALWRAARAQDIDAGAAALRDLIGCGMGLTPAGDDIVVGFLAGLRATACADDRRLAWSAALGESASALTDRTNPISGAYILHAVNGGFAEPIARLASAIATGAGEDDIARAARPALGVGATSGEDGVRGLLLGFAAWGRVSVNKGTRCG